MSRHQSLRIALAAGLAVATVSAASAHELAKGPNGGPVADTAGHHVEFVYGWSDVAFYLTEETNAPIASAGAKMKTIVQDAGKTAQVELAPAEPNKLVGKLAAPLAKGAKVVVTGTLADGHSIQAKFVVP